MTSTNFIQVGQRPLIDQLTHRHPGWPAMIMSMAVGSGVSRDGSVLERALERMTYANPERRPVRAENLCHQAIFMNHASGRGSGLGR
jgi:hypothetical protein